MKKVVLSIAMLLCFCGTIFAQNAWKVGSAEYATLAEAVTAASDGATIEMTANATSGAVTINKNLTIDLGGYTLTTSDGQTLHFTAGTTTLQNGTIVSAYSRPIQINGATVTLGSADKSLNVNATGNGNAVRVASGEVIIENANITNNGDAYAVWILTGGKITMNGGNITSTNNDGIRVGHSEGAQSEAVVNNGTITGIGVSNGKLTVNNATVTATVSSEDASTISLSSGEVNIYGGTFTSTNLNAVRVVNGTCNIIDGKFVANNAKTVYRTTTGSGLISISGGTFSDDVAAYTTPYLADGYTTVSNADDTYSVVAAENVMVNVVKDNTTKNFANLAAAVKYVKENNLNDVTINILKSQESGKVVMDFQATLDLNSTNNTLTLTEGTAITVTEGGDVTIKNGIIDGNGKDDIINANGGKITLGEDLKINNTSSIVWAHNAGEVIVDGAELNITNASYAGVFADGNNSSIKMVKGLMSQTGNNHVTVSIANGAKLEVEDGTITNSHSSTLVAKNNGEVTLNGGTVECTSENPSYCAIYCIGGGKVIVNDGATVTAKGSAVVANKWDATTGGGELEINGGNITSSDNHALVVHEAATSKATIKGGIIKSEKYAAVLCKLGTITIDNTDAAEATSTTSATEKAPVIIGGGTGTTAIIAQDNGTVVINNEGGVYSSDVTEFINPASDPALACTAYNYEGNNYFTVATANVKVTYADNSEKLFATLKDAINSLVPATPATVGSTTTPNPAGSTITVLNDHESGAANGINFETTIDLNGNTVTLTETQALNVVSGGNVTITDNSTDAAGQLKSTRNILTITDGASATVEKGELISENGLQKDAVVMVDGTDSKFILKDGRITGEKMEYTVRNIRGASFTMYGGAVINSAHSVGSVNVAVECGANAVINDGVLTSTGASNVMSVQAGADYTEGVAHAETTAEIYGGTFTLGARPIYAGANGSQKQCTLTVNGGDFTCEDRYVFGAAKEGNIIIKGGNITSTKSYAAYAYENTGKITIEGGVLTSKESNAVQVGKESQKGEVIINGGKIVSENNAAVNAFNGTVTINNTDDADATSTTSATEKAPVIIGGDANKTAVNKTDNGTVLINNPGGVYSSDVTEFVADGLACTAYNYEGNNYFTVATANVEVTYNTTPAKTQNFANLADAVAALKSDAHTDDRDGSTIKLLNDQESGLVDINFETTLDVNTKTLTLTANEALTVSGNGDVTMKNGNIATKANETDFINANGGKITLGEDLKISNTVGAIVYAHNGGKVTVDGAEMTSEGTNYTMIYGDGGADVLVKSGKFESGKAIVAAGGSNSTLTIEDGELTTVNGVTAYVKDGAKGVINGGKIKSEKSNAFAAQSGATAEINGGELHSDGSYIACSWANSTITLNDGKLTSGSYGVCANSGTWNINGGEITSKWSGVMVYESDNAKAIIKGGKITSTNYYGVQCSKGSVEIKNDSTESAVKVPEICGAVKSVWNEGPVNNQSGAANGNGNITITGGVFCDDVENDADKYAETFVDENYGTIGCAGATSYPVVEKIEVTITAGEPVSVEYNGSEQSTMSTFTAMTANQDNVTAYVEFVSETSTDAITGAETTQSKGLVKGTDAGVYPLVFTADMFKRSANACDQQPMKFKVADDETFNFTITKKEVTITKKDFTAADNDPFTKVYDGKALEANVINEDGSSNVEVAGLVLDHKLSAGTVTTDDYVAGTYTCAVTEFADVTSASISNFAIVDGSDNSVIANYTPKFVDFTLTISQLPLTITATDSKDYNMKDFGPREDPDLTDNDNLGYTYDETALASGDELTATITGSQICPGESANEIATVKITKSDDGDRDVTASYNITKVAGTLTVIMPCADGETYGWQCWAKENLKDGNGKAYKEDDANADKFGLLYTWYEAATNGTDETAEIIYGTDETCGKYIQGICPDGYGLPTAEDFQALSNYVGGADKMKSADTQYWLPEKAGVEPVSKFDSRGGGIFNSATDRYELLLGTASYWTADESGATAKTVNVEYYCSEPMQKSANKNDRRSVRCIKKSIE